MFKQNGNREENGANNDNDNSDNDNDNQETTRGGRQRNGGGNQRGGDVGRSNGRNLITWNNFRRLRRRVCFNFLLSQHAYSLFVTIE